MKREKSRKGKNSEKGKFERIKNKPNNFLLILIMVN